MLITRSSLMKTYGICGETYRTWIKEGLPCVVIAGIKKHNHISVEKWVFDKKTQWKWSRQRYAVKKGVKRCSVCGRMRPLNDFSKDLQKAGGKSSRCLSCDRKKCRLYALTKIRTKSIRFQRLYTEAKRDPKFLARRKLSNAVHKGKKIKPKNCDKCGRRVENPYHLHGHHEDYSKPLDVQWLCTKCHGLTRRKSVD